MPLFSSSKNLTLNEIKKIVDHISSLDYKEKERVIGAFSTVDEGGVSKEEFRKTIYALWNSHKISEIDYANLKQVWEEQY